MSRNNDNTAAGMALSQEESMYLTPEPSPIFLASEDKENHPIICDDIKLDDDVVKQSCHESQQDVPIQQTSPVAETVVQSNTPVTTQTIALSDQMFHPQRTQMDLGKQIEEIETTNLEHGSDVVLQMAIPKGLAKVDLEMNRFSQVKMWDFTDKIPSSRTPSAMLQPYAKYVGTQQSGHNTYKVEVTILTVNMEQSDLSGFLKISDLTPEHPVLETFFTGEIVGGPNQRYSFRTMDPTWGTGEKVDMQHWMRFPAWRQFNSIAKRDMSFEYPLNGQAWYQQEHIFMRWKERFLAPDHRKSNLSGASFEGFYYICLNQMEGRISGVYFHSNSEK